MVRPRGIQVLRLDAALPSWTSADPDIAVDVVVCIWLVFSDWSDIEEAVVTAGRLDTEDAEFGLEVVLIERLYDFGTLVRLSP
jgi:hypothetical protein